MRRALALARRGAGWAAPNPMVGAILVSQGQIVGQGWHRCFGQNHAEINALADCRRRGSDSSGATLFVTLEPCCHHGKTPPCTEAIVEAGIAEVEVATLDDFVRVNGKGVDQLRQRGVTVRVGRCEDQARRLNAGYFTLQKTSRPRVTLKWAQSADGKLAWPADSGRFWITGTVARRHVHRIRSRCEAVMVGIGTILADDPLLNVRGIVNAFQPRRVVLDSRLRIPLESRLVQTAKDFPVLLYTAVNTRIWPGPPDSKDLEKIDQLQRAGVDVCVIPTGFGGLDLSAILEDLARRGVCDLLVEGGPAVLNRFLSQDLADAVLIYTSGCPIGPEGLDSGFSINSLQQFKKVDERVLGEDMLIEWCK